MPGALFSLLFPDDCRICGQPLRDISRVPVCQACLSAPKPFVAEHFCSVCGTPFANAFPLDEEGRCAICRLGTRGFDAVYCFGGYEGVLRELVHLLKFGGVRTLARPMGRYLSAVLPREERFDAIVPMPLHWRRRWQRGFNQAELLSLELARCTGIPVRRLVRRTRPTAQQAGLSNARRRSNVTGAFAVRRGTSLKGLRILLVDDVMTTGATAAACSLALKRAGAARVALLALARTDRRMPGALVIQGTPAGPRPRGVA